MKIYIILMIFCFSLEAKNNLVNCDSSYKKIWHEFLYGEKSNTEKMLAECTFNNEVVIDSINVLKAKIFYSKKEYKKAIAVLHYSENRILKSYNLRNTKLRENESINDIGYLYFSMLSSLADSNYALGKYRTALKYYQQWILSSEKEFGDKGLNASVFMYAAYCSYLTQQYEKAMGLLKKAYKLSTLQAEKANISYNISALYARNKDFNATLTWLQYPLEVNETLYIQKISQDNDFSFLIRDNSFRNKIGLH